MITSKLDVVLNMNHQKKNIILFVFLFLLSIKSFSQINEKHNNKCLVIIGVEHRYTQVTNTKSSTQVVIDNINSVIEKINPDNIVYVYSVHKALYLTKKGSKTGLDSIGMIRDERLHRVNSNIILKKEVNAFADKEFIKFLQKNKSKEIIIVGLSAEYYIKEALLSGKELGYNMYFIPEAIMGKSVKKKEIILNKLKKNGIKELPINQLIN